MRPTTIAILLAAAALVGCASTPPSPAASKVPVYAAPLDEPAGSHRLPEGCNEISRQPAAHWTVPRQCSDCPAASPITDCPPCTGAWYDVVFVSYACPVKALAELPAERLP